MAGFGGAAAGQAQSAPAQHPAAGAGRRPGPGQQRRLGGNPRRRARPDVIPRLVGQAAALFAASGVVGFLVIRRFAHVR